MALQVIGTGFGRTGTDSMREALTLLGFGPCHHMVEINQHDTQKQRWRALALGEAPDWESLFEGYRSCVDWPSAHYWRELIASYPNLKEIVWTQEEPRNMGCWKVMSRRLPDLIIFPTWFLGKARCCTADYGGAILITNPDIARSVKTKPVLRMPNRSRKIPPSRAIKRKVLGTL